MPCPNCGGPLTKGTVDQHPYRYDRGKPILLLGVTECACPCGYHAVEIPRVGPLHRTIEEALRMLRVKRDEIAFIFEHGPSGVEDGEWNIVVQTAAK